MAYDCRPHSTDSNEPMLPYPPSSRQTARSDGNVTATSTSHRVRVPTTIRMRDLQIQTKHLTQPFRSKTMLQITRIYDSARRRIITGHIIRIRIRLVAGDTSHDRHVVEALRNLLKTVRHQNHGAVRLLRTNTTQRMQSNLTPPKSRPVVGSSRISKSGSAINARQISTRVRSPSESLNIILPSRYSMPNSRINERALA